MTSNPTNISLQLQQYASILGASGVALGAFGAHALKAKLQKNDSLDNWKTAVLYQLFSATAVLGVACLTTSRSYDRDIEKANEFLLVGKLMTIGTIMFSGSIYMLCLGVGPKMILGPTTPIGGLFMISGWVLLGIRK